jgi:hypothetical protein
VSMQFQFRLHRNTCIFYYLREWCLYLILTLQAINAFRYLMSVPKESLTNYWKPTDQKTLMMANSVPAAVGGDNNIANALSSRSTPSSSTDNQFSQPEQREEQKGWTSLMGAARDAVSRSTALTQNVSNAASTLSTNIGQNVNLLPFHSLTKSISNNITGRNTLPDKTTASQVLMFRQLLHTKCRPGLRLSRGYEGTAAQLAVLHMPVRSLFVCGH